MEMNDAEHTAGVTEAVKLSSFLRGAVINEVAFLEIMIDIFLANHFCKGPTEKRDFLKIVMQTKYISFESKRIIFHKLITCYYPDFPKRVKDYHKLIDKIRDCRNKLAHSQLDISPNGIENFIKTKNIFLLDSIKESKELKYSEVETVIYNSKWIANEIGKINNNYRKVSSTSELPNVDTQ